MSGHARGPAGARASAAGRRALRPPAGARSRRSPTSRRSTSSRRSARRRPRSRSWPRAGPADVRHGHLLAYRLRVTIRDPDEDDRLIAARAWTSRCRAASSCGRVSSRAGAGGQRRGDLRGGGDQPVVLVGIADRDAETVGERMTVPERPRHEAAAHQRDRGRLRALRRARGRAAGSWSPTAAGPSRRASSAAASRGRSRSTRSTFSRMAAARASAAATTVAETCRPTPAAGTGRRGGSSPRSPTANPTRSPASAYALEAVRTATTFGYRVRSPITERPLNSAVGLVDDDGGRRAGRPRRRRPRCPRAGARSRLGFRAARSGCWGCRPRRASPRGRAHRRPDRATSIAQPSACGPGAGPAITRPPRCSAWIRYIA